MSFGLSGVYTQKVSLRPNFIFFCLGIGKAYRYNKTSNGNAITDKVISILDRR